MALQSTRRGLQLGSRARGCHVLGEYLARTQHQVHARFTVLRHDLTRNFNRLQAEVLHEARAAIDEAFGLSTDEWSVVCLNHAMVAIATRFFLPNGFDHSLDQLSLPLST